MSARPRLLLFDLDGVLADYDRPARVATLAAAAGAGIAEMYEAMFGARGLEHDGVRGEPGLDGLLAGLRERHGWGLLRGHFLEARRTATQLRPEMISLCRSLQPQARLAVFTNNGDWMGTHIAAVAPGIRALFGDAIVCSGALRESKPRAEAFQACLRQLELDTPADVLFIDDNADNVEGARRAGLDAVLFTDIATLRRDLYMRGFDLQGERQDAP